MQNIRLAGILTKNALDRKIINFHSRLLDHRVYEKCGSNRISAFRAWEQVGNLPDAAVKNVA